ncbi:MAG: NlpC/P60 family protein [Saprospiraceae bacterium]|nr:NlpC/P60 family protein [Saprospiraceae bacterium]
MCRFSLLLLLVSTFGCQQKYQLRLAKQIAEETRLAYAPDKRVALFRIDTLTKSKPMVVFGETNLPEAKTAFFEKMRGAGLEFSDSLVLLPDSKLNGKTHGVVSVSVCNFRSEPRHSAELATQALMGSSLRVWKQQGDFFLVQSPDGYFGWLDDGGLQLMTDPEHERWLRNRRGICLQDFVFAYENADESSGKVTDLLAGNIVQLLENQGAFTKIMLPDGRIGFVKSNQLMPLPDWVNSRQPNAQQLLNTAKEMMGRPYLWGGTSGKGMDCSGFTKMAYYLNGIQLPRDASQQVHVGELVDTDTATWKNLQPGDLLFFGRKATPEKKERITHVAMYLGEGKIIHASDRIKVESIVRGGPGFAEDRVASFVRCKRIIGQAGKNGVVRVSDLPDFKLRP